MKKRFLVLGAAVLIAACIGGCGKKAADVNAQELADALKNGITYEDDLSSIDLDTAQMIYNFGDANIAEAVLMRVREQLQRR